MIHLNFHQIRKSAKYSGFPYRIESHKECDFNDDLKIVVCSGMKVEFGSSPLMLPESGFINDLETKEARLY